MRKWLIQALTPILCALTLLLGVIVLGRSTRAALRDQDAYAVAFVDIDCHPPEGVARADFLHEVQSVSRLPDRLPLLDEKVTSQLARAFSLHPWVESVSRIHVQNPNSRVQVELVHRRPVLAVCLPGDKFPHDGSALVATWSGTSRATLVSCRAVDRHGVLLPVAAVRSRMPVFTGKVAPPTGRPGTVWGDRGIAAAAATVNFLKPHLDRLQLNDCDIEIVREEVIIRKPGLRVTWGHAPGQEVAGEAAADVKLNRLLDYHASHDGLEGLEHDVRLLAHQGHFPLSLFDQP
jgi:hypothetical protein